MRLNLINSISWIIYLKSSFYVWNNFSLFFFFQYSKEMSGGRKKHIRAIELDRHLVMIPESRFPKNWWHSLSRVPIDTLHWERPKIVLEIHEAPQMFTYFLTALADSRTVSRSRGRNVGVRTCVGRIEKDEDVSLPTHICACFDTDK